MRKWLILFLLLIVTGIIAIYLFIPGTLAISTTAYLNTPSDIAYRNLSEESKWLRWWPADSSTTSATDTSSQAKFVVENINYTIVHKSINEIEIVIESAEEKLNSRVLVIPLKKDSTALHWTSVIETGFNPFGRVQHYNQAKTIKKNMETIFNSLRSYLGNKANLYSIPIERTTVKDTLLVTTKVQLDHYPTTEEVYNIIGKLKQYAAREKADPTNYPMLHVLKKDSNVFQMMVAVPVNKQIGDNNNFVFKRMVPGNILVTNVKGGRNLIDKAFVEMELYVKDNQLVPPAIPFQSLVTDRLNEPDSNKWVTRISFPIL